MTDISFIDLTEKKERDSILVKYAHISRYKKLLFGGGKEEI